MIYICYGYEATTDFSELEKYCSLERITKARTYKNNIDYGNCLISYCLLRLGLNKKKSYSFTKEEKWEYKNGKPFIKGCEIKFSISHTKNACAVILSNKEVGIDIENKFRNITCEKSIEEWTKKEAAFKGGLRLKDKISTIEINDYKISFTGNIKNKKQIQIFDYKNLLQILIQNF